MSFPDSEEEQAAASFDAQLRHQLGDFASPQPLPAGGLADVRARLAAASGAPVPVSVPASRLRPFAGGVGVGMLLLLTGWWGGKQWASLPAPTPVSAPIAQLSATGAPVSASTTQLSAIRTPVSASTTRLSVTGAPVSATAPRLSATGALVSETGTTVSPSTVRLSATGAPVSASTVRLPAPGASVSATATVTPALPLLPVGTLAAADTLRPADATAGLPARWVRAVALDTAVRHQWARPAADTSRAAETARQTHLRALLTAETAALAALQASVDSLKAALPETPPTLAATPQTLKPSPPHTLHLVALLETTPSWATVPVQNPTDDNERTQTSLSQSLLLERAVGSRWLFRAGVGQLTTQSLVRRTSERSGQTTVRDSSLTTDVTVRFTTTTVLITHLDSVLHVEPRLNLSGQIIRYDTTWLPTSTVIALPTTSADTLRTTRQVTSSRTTQWREARQQLFRPQYRFWTLPLSAQYQFLQTDRWTLGLTLGGQLSVFRGGTRPVWNGEDYVLQAVSGRDGPYRPLSLSLNAGLEASYRLSPRLALLAAPTVRWWAVPPGRAGNQTQPWLPAGQVGLRYGF